MQTRVAPTQKQGRTGMAAASLQLDEVAVVVWELPRVGLMRREGDGVWHRVVESACKQPRLDMSARATG